MTGLNETRSMLDTPPLPVLDSRAMAAIEAWDGAVARHKLYEIELDMDGRMIRIVTRGLWTTDEVDRYFALIQYLVSLSRNRFGRARVMVDGREAGVQSAEVASRFLSGNRIFSQPGDKLALIAGSSLQKMQVRRMLVSPQTEAFVSPAAAITWLNAFP